MTSILFDHEDVARGQLDAALTAAALTIVLKTGEGAEFPQPLTGDCSSLGSATALNDTGGLGSLAVGDFIRNVTDGSWAYVTSIAGAPNAVVTTPLIGGSDNTWQNADVWRHGEFVVTLTKTADGTPTGTVSKRERVLISNRSTDQLTVPTGGRGFDGTSAQSFDPDDFVNLYIGAVTFDYLRDVLKDVRNYMATLRTDTDSNTTSITNLNNSAPSWLDTITGTDTLTGSATPAPATGYPDGYKVAFIVAVDNTGAVTLNVNSKGAKDLKAPDGSALAAGELQAGGIVECRYDQTSDDWLMTSQKHVISSAQDVSHMVSSIDASANMDGGSYTTGESYTFAGGELQAGDTIDVWANLSCDGGTRNTLTRFNGSNCDEMVGVRYGRLHMIIQIRTSTTAYVTTHMYEQASTGYAGYGTAIGSLNLANPIAVDIQGKQTAGAESQHYIQQFIVKKSRPKATQ